MPTLLIIEDDHHILLMIKRMLEPLGYEIKLASDGNEGLEMFHKFEVDLVITDIIMPEKEGLEIIREMRRERPNLQIIAMSGGGKISADNYLETAKIFGAAKILEKPFSRTQMVSAVQHLLGESKTGSNQKGKPGAGNDLEKEQGR
jgi:DNA-binding NtrC family response regulator